jgi:hypothetical protein
MVQKDIIDDPNWGYNLVSPRHKIGTSVDAFIMAEMRSSMTFSLSVLCDIQLSRGRAISPKGPSFSSGIASAFVVGE